jgi:hypothetical protein
MLLKLMSSENKPDDSTSKGCTIIDKVRDITYFKNEPTNEMCLRVTYSEPLRELITELFTLSGNAYLMNDSGKTIQSYACHPGVEC